MKQNLCKADNENSLKDTETPGVHPTNTRKYCHSACFKKKQQHTESHASSLFRSQVMRNLSHTAAVTRNTSLKGTG